MLIQTWFIRATLPKTEPLTRDQWPIATPETSTTARSGTCNATGAWAVNAHGTRGHEKPRRPDPIGVATLQDGTHSKTNPALACEQDLPSETKEGRGKARGQLHQALPRISQLSSTKPSQLHPWCMRSGTSSSSKKSYLRQPKARPGTFRTKTSQTCFANPRSVFMIEQTTRQYAASYATCTSVTRSESKYIIMIHEPRNGSDCKAT